MQTLLAAITMAGSIAANNIPDHPRWQQDYFEARAIAYDTKKPLAVFLGSGKSGMLQALDPKVNEWLREKYVSVFIDTDTEAGQKLARSFAVQSKGLVISDRSGDSQQFHHSGPVSREDLLKALQRYSDPNRVFRATETLAQLSPPPPPPVVPNYSYAPIRLSGG